MQPHDSSILLQMTLLKKCTVLSKLSEDKWNNTHQEVMHEFFETESQQLLVAYIDPQSSELFLCFNLPPFQLPQVAYFIRQENVVVTGENFHHVLQMGTVQGNYVDTLLRVMHGLYAPNFFENKTWPDSILSCSRLPVYIHVYTCMESK